MATLEARLIFIEDVVIILKFSCLFLNNFFNDLLKSFLKISLTFTILKALEIYSEVLKD